MADNDKKPETPKASPYLVTITVGGKTLPQPTRVRARNAVVAIRKVARDLIEPADGVTSTIVFSVEPAAEKAAAPAVAEAFSKAAS